METKKFVVWAQVCALLAVGLLASAWAQESSLRGTVYDPQKAIMPGVTVTLISPGTGLTRSDVSDETGRYSFTRVPPGKYTVKAEQSGFKTIAHENIQLL